MTKLLRPRVLQIGKRFSQSAVSSLFLDGLKEYGNGHLPSVVSKVEQIFRNSGLQGGNFVFDPSGMKISKRTALAGVEEVHKSATKAAVNAFKELDSEVDKVFVSTEMPGCPPLGHLLPHSNTLTLTGHGCLGAISLIDQGAEYLRQHPKRKIGLYAVEIPSRVWATQFPVDLRKLVEIDLQHQNSQGPVIDVYKPIIYNTVVAALMRDNATYTTMVGHQHPDFKHEPGWIIRASVFEKYSEAVSYVGTSPAVFGTRMFLSPKIPSFIAPRAKAMLAGLLKRHGLTLGEIKHILLHPGGPKVLDEVEKEIGFPIPLQYSRASLAEFGNCMSTSVFDVIRRNFEHAKPGDSALIYGVGPGMKQGAHYAFFG